MKNDKGFTLIELVVSLVLISIILLFITELYIRIRNVERAEKVDIQFELSKSVIMDSIMRDIIEDGCEIVPGDGTNIIFRFDNIGEKELRLFKKSGNYYLSYICRGSICGGRESVVRKLPADIKRPYDSWITYKEIYSDTEKKLSSITIPLQNGHDENCDINMYFRKDI